MELFLLWLQNQENWRGYDSKTTAFKASWSYSKNLGNHKRGGFLRNNKKKEWNMTIELCRQAAFEKGRISLREITPPIQSKNWAQIRAKWSVFSYSRTWFKPPCFHKIEMQPKHTLSCLLPLTTFTPCWLISVLKLNQNLRVYNQRY